MEEAGPTYNVAAIHWILLQVLALERKAMLGVQAAFQGHDLPEAEPYP